MEFREFGYDKTGRFRSRRWSRHQLREGVDATATQWKREPFAPTDAVEAELLRRCQKEVLEAWAVWLAEQEPVLAVPELPVPSEVLAIMGDEASARDQEKVDRALERLLRDVQRIAQSKMSRRGTRGEEARRVDSTLFPDGRSFTQGPLRRQQTTTADRLAALGRIAPGAAAAIDAADEIAELTRLNAWLGQLLGLGEQPALEEDGSAPEPAPAPEPEESSDARERLLVALTALLTCVHTIWPEASAAHVHARRQLVGPLLDELFG